MFSYYNSLRNYYVRKNSVDFSLGLLTDEPSEKVKMNRWRTCHSKTTVFENTSKLSHQVQFSPNSSKIGFVEERLFYFKHFYFFFAQQSFF